MFLPLKIGPNILGKPYWKKICFCLLQMTVTPSFWNARMPSLDNSTLRRRGSRLTIIVGEKKSCVNPKLCKNTNIKKYIGISLFLLICPGFLSHFNVELSQPAYIYILIPPSVCLTAPRPTAGHLSAGIRLEPQTAQAQRRLRPTVTARQCTACTTVHCNAV